MYGQKMQTRRFVRQHQKRICGGREGMLANDVRDLIGFLKMSGQPWQSLLVRGEGTYRVRPNKETSRARTRCWRIRSRRCRKAVFGHGSSR